MPVVTLTVPPVTDSVSRSVARGLGHEFNKRLGIPDDTHMLLTTTVGHPTTTEGTQDKVQAVDRLPPLDSDRQLVLTVREELQDQGLLHNAVYREEYPYIFRDNKVGLTIRPNYAYVRLTMEFRYRFRHQTEAEGLVRRMRLHGGLHSIPNEHRLHYQYGLPDSLIAFIYDVHQMRESVGNYGESLAAYLRRCFVEGGLSARSTQDGTRHALAVNEVQHNVIGLFTEDLYYRTVEQEESGYVVGFELQIDYQQILSVVARYPLIVHNQRIPVEYIRAWQPPKFASIAPSEVLSYIPPPPGEPTPYYYAGDGGYRLDPIDDWFPNRTHTDIITQVVSPLQVYTPDPTLVLNLHDFPSDVLPDFIRDLLIAFPDAATRPYELPYTLYIYRVCEREQLTTVTLEPDGTVRSLLPMDPTCRYYIRIGVLTDLTRLPTNFVHWMLKNPALTLAILQHIYPGVTLDGQDGWLESANGKWIIHKSYDATLKRIPTSNAIFRGMDSRMPKLTQRSIIEAHLDSER